MPLYIDLIKLPPHSPDLDPIENLWADLKRRIELRFPRDIAKLREVLAEEWESTPRSTKDVKIIATLFACIFPLNGSAVRMS